MDATQSSQALLVPAVPSKAKHTILFLAANDERSLDHEARAIQDELERAGYRNCFEFVTRWAVQPLDLLRELRKLKPTVVHLSGPVRQRRLATETTTREVVRIASNSMPSNLRFMDLDGQPQPVSPETLAQTFAAAGSSVKLVILGARNSELDAVALLAHVQCVVRMSISADAARGFAIGFYGGLGERESVATAFKQGQAAIRLYSDGACWEMPKLLTRPEVDANDIYIVGQSRKKIRCTLVIKAKLEEFNAEAIARVRDELRLLTGEVSLEIIEIHEGSVKLTVSLSATAAARLQALRDSGRLKRICGFKVSVLRGPAIGEEGRDGEGEEGRDGNDGGNSTLTRVDAQIRRRRELAGQRAGADFMGAMLSGAKLNRINLRGANLYAADLSGADLSDVNLSEADLSGADLSEANLSGADLSEANLSEGRLGWVDLSEANLSGANLSGANLFRANLFRADLSDVNLHGADLSAANLWLADLRGADLSEAILSEGSLIGAKLSGANLSDVKLSDVKLSGFGLGGAKLSDAGVDHDEIAHAPKRKPVA